LWDSGSKPEGEGDWWKNLTLDGKIASIQSRIFKKKTKNLLQQKFFHTKKLKILPRKISSYAAGGIDA